MSVGIKPGDDAAPSVPAKGTPDQSIPAADCIHLTQSSVPQSAFAKGGRSSRPLRICCFGSGSSKTPQPYLQAAAELGYLLAVRGHVCVNGAGSFGCMAALNEGAAAGNGDIVGVIHEMWLVDADMSTTLRDGGAHFVFLRDGDSHEKPTERPVREMLVAGGPDLQERKRLLVKGAEALIVLPGGPGTWDELWEMACAKNLGLSQLPIVCININGYYEPFREMLERAWKDELTKLLPQDIVYFVDSPEEAVRWVEEAHNRGAPNLAPRKRQQGKDLRSLSVIGSPVVETGDNSFTQRPSNLPMPGSRWTQLALSLGMGIALGFLLSERSRRHY